MRELMDLEEERKRRCGIGSDGNGQRTKEEKFSRESPNGLKGKQLKAECQKVEVNWLLHGVEDLAENLGTGGKKRVQAPKKIQEKRGLEGGMGPGSLGKDLHPFQCPMFLRHVRATSDMENLGARPPSCAWRRRLPQRPEDTKMFHGKESERRSSSRERKQTRGSQLNNVNEFAFLNLHGMHLSLLEASQCCSSLRICILSKNFLTDMSPLRSCTKLIKLDLHSNQIRIVPDKTFWVEMKELKLLYLHDNSFVKLKNVCSLSACPNLMALTLYDCPVSLKKGYRHVLVNSIWSLKILDHYVISDDEVIENWTLPERFKAFNKRLLCDITSVVAKGTNYEKEVGQMNGIISKINKIVAHNSPVVIVQRWIRGHLTRRMWTKPYLKGLPRKFVLPEKVTIKLPKKNEGKSMTKEDDKSDSETEEEKPTSPESKVKKFPKAKRVLKPYEIFPLKHKDLVSCALSELRKKESPIQPPKIKRHRVAKVSEEKKTVDQEMGLNFRMPVIKVHMSLPSIRKYSSEPREIKREIYHRPIYRLCHFIEGQSKFKISHRFERDKKKEATRTHGTLDFSPLYSIDRQYNNKEKVENVQKKIQFVAMLQIADEVANENVHEYLQEKNYLIKKRNKEQSKKLEESFQKFQETRLRLMDKFQERRNSFLEGAKFKAQERLMVGDMSNQHTTLAKELFQFDRYKGKQDIVMKNKRLVKEMKHMDKYNKELVKQMKKGRIKAIHKRHVEEQLIIHTIATQKASDRIQEVKNKVAAMKSHRVHVNLPYGHPKNSFLSSSFTFLK
ncbi:leucine-rich repeat and IQ domain-containing protein 3 [Dromiciops gliroides]|uniref:leucine-rich repeat and IQ domain-containing protein 3 n=1 Tax=Dromiciops gliroides TaxID=33562 RepID=UPI001CC3B482|nr:leucine-rich repeat and IQ domain-containing protein 3 [Dromiciops gliroides]